jgi:hypothetical protein
MIMSAEQSVEWELARIIEVLEKKTCPIVGDHKSHVTWFGIDPGPQRNRVLNIYVEPFKPE